MNAAELVEVVLPGQVQPDGLELRYGSVPAPGAGQGVIAMEATGVSFAAQVAARLPLARVADALRSAESGTVTGKVVLTP